MATLAVIDMGTNTFRLLVAEIENASSFKEICSMKERPRLGEGFAKDKVFLPSAVERAVSTLSHFKGVLHRYRIDDVAVVGTSAIREAKNQKEFLRQIQDQTSFDVRVISGEEEALYTFLGVNLVMQNKSDSMLVIDIGGGSTEFIGAEGDSPTFLLSTELGAVHLTEKYLHSDPPSPEELRRLRLAIDKVIKPIGYHFPPRGRFVGTAGTVTNLAAIDQQLTVYQPEKINHYSLPRASVERIFKELSSMTTEQRRNIPGLEEGREDILISGTLVLLAVMDLFGYNPVYVSDCGLREGVLIEHYRKRYGENK